MTPPGGQGVTVGDQGVTNHRIPALEPLHAFTDLLHPPRVLVSQDVRKLHVPLLTPDSLNDMKVGTAHAGSPDPYEDIRVIHKFGFRHLLQDDKVRSSQCGVISMKYGSFHNSGQRNWGLGTFSKTKAVNHPFNERPSYPTE